ncbi:phytoene desaturase family protein [Paenibacillus beijingensis]|uniref:Pyridine nucleotide-disulfide oxidoreductase domain-containing protein 2 n=1 Tax=Paenibacillus beijingensis TaxID=1126833 RepID=A0A0D5NFL1_9BACL|nr:NAD(P)/FAD-dependent oxidoreductase [Paenibacillus beijingensis]AJY74149.1 oxidoreductase [Paenibacillus beijingensis]
MTDADIIVVGSGHNGLAAALKLARSGWRVVVLERANQPGGAAKTAEITLPGFKHDLYATNIGLFLGSALYREMGSELHRNGFETVVSDKPFVSVFPDDDAISVYRNPEKTLREFERQSAKDAAAWTDLLAYFQQTSPYLLPIMQLPMPSLALAKHLFQLYRRLGRTGSLELMKLLLQTPRQFAESWFESEKVQSLFIPWSFHLDFGPDVAGGAMFPFLEVPLDHMNGMALAKGGVGTLIQSMIRTLESMGGKVVLGRHVSKIIVQNGRAAGVEMEDGEKLFAKYGVIANVNPSQLIEKLIAPEHLPSQYVKRVQTYRYGPGTMMIHLAMNAPLNWKANDELSQFSYVHIGPYTSDVAQTYTDALNGRLPASPLLVVGQQSSPDPSRAPENKHTLWVQVRALPAKPKSDALNEIHSASWREMKEQYADRVIDKIAEYAPNIKETVLARHVMSPRDLQADNPNLVGGDSVSGSHHLDQNYLFRPVPGWSRYNTPIQGLFLTGASTWPGGGLNATSGYMLAEQLLRKGRRI